MVQQPTYVIRRAFRPPALGASWDSPDWSAAEVIDVDQFHPESSDHRPRVQAKLLYDDRSLYVQFRVFDRYVRCVETRDQGRVYLDSCVEFFVQPGEDASRGYFNFEMNCGGALLLYYIERPGKTLTRALANFAPVGSDWLEQVRRFQTLPRRVEPEMTEPVEWRVAYAVPMKMFEHYVGAMPPPEKRAWRGNFFKCADATSHPHWGMWSPVEILNFHQPEKFGELRFGP